MSNNKELENSKPVLFSVLVIGLLLIIFTPQVTLGGGTGPSGEGSISGTPAGFGSAAGASADAAEANTGYPAFDLNVMWERTTGMNRGCAASGWSNDMADRLCGGGGSTGASYSVSNSAPAAAETNKNSNDDSEQGDTNRSDRGAVLNLIDAGVDTVANTFAQISGTLADLAKSMFGDEPSSPRVPTFPITNIPRPTVTVDTNQNIRRNQDLSDEQKSESMLREEAIARSLETNFSDEDLFFEIKVVNSTGDIVYDWTSQDVEIEASDEIFFRWQARSHEQCLPFLADSGRYSLEYANNLTMLSGNTESENFDTPEQGGIYRLECKRVSGNLVDIKSIFVGIK